MVVCDTPAPILLVDDDLNDIELMRDAFADSRLANPLEVAHDGVEALAFLEQAQPLPSLVLLDLNMPRLGGLEVLRRMRASRRTRIVPVIILTTSDEPRDVLEAYELGVNSYIQKPVKFSDFREVVAALGLYWLLYNKVPERT